MGIYLNIAAVRPCTESEGPGKRFALWVQGCLQRCPDCCNSQMQAIKRAHIVEVRDVFDLVLKAKSDYEIEGVSFIGGEPLLQAEGLGALAELCQKRGLSVLVFTGFQYEAIKKSNDENLLRLIKNTDLLIDGLYDKDLPDEERDWIGSKNQRAIFLTDRYKPGVEFEKRQRSMEIRITENELLMNGWPF